MPRDIITIRRRGGIFFPPPVAGVTWDPATAGVGLSLSGGNLIVQGDGSGSTSVYGTTSHGSGKYYFEVKYTGAITSNTSQIGIGSSVNTYPTAGFVWCDTNLGESWKVNNTPTAVASAPCGVGDTMGVAVDLNNNRLWGKSDLHTDWNQNATADPTAPGSGGSDLSLIRTGGDTVRFFVYLRGGTPGQICTLNTAGPFHFAASYTALQAGGFGLWT